MSLRFKQDTCFIILNVEKQLFCITIFSLISLCCGLGDASLDAAKGKLIYFVFDRVNIVSD